MNKQVYCIWLYFSAVQEERQRVKEKGDGEVESTSGANSDMPVEQILDAELAVDPKTGNNYMDTQVSHSHLIEHLVNVVMWNTQNNSLILLKIFGQLFDTFE